MDRVTLLNKVALESSRIEENCTYSSKAHFNSCAIWKKIHFGLGIVLVIMSGISVFCGDIKWLAIAILIFANIQTFIRPDKNANDHLNAGNNYLALKNNVRQFSECRIINLEAEVVLSEMKNFTELLNYLNQSSPMPLDIAYKKAQEGIKNGEAKFRADKESE